ncbi:MAG: hypothetical protein NVS3B12_08990 [Acidimicrobiales bacterium]
MGTPVDRGRRSASPLSRRRGSHMADKSPKKPMAKKPGASLKEKRSAKKMKKDGASSPAIGSKQK